MAKETTGEASPQHPPLNPPPEKGTALLEDVMVAFQKALARVAEQTAAEQRQDRLFLSGQRTLFGIDGLDVELKVGLGLYSPSSPTEDTGHPDQLLVDFDALPEERSALRFRVEALPLEPPSEYKVDIHWVRPATSDEPRHRYHVTLLDPDGIPMAGEPLTVYVRDTDSGTAHSNTGKTRKDGSIEIVVAPPEGKFLVANRPKRLPFPASANEWEVWVVWREIATSDLRVVRRLKKPGSEK